MHVSVEKFYSLINLLLDATRASQYLLLLLLHAIDIGKLKEEKKTLTLKPKAKFKWVLRKETSLFVNQCKCSVGGEAKTKKTAFELSRVFRVCSQLLAFFSSEKRAFLKKLVLLFLFLKFGPIPNPKLLEHKYTFYPSTQHMIAYVMHLVHVIEGKQLR